MSAATTQNTEEEQKFGKPAGQSSWPVILTVVLALSVSGWIYLGAMVAAMVPSMDMATAGPGMQIFNQFNLFNGLSDDARAALAVICLPAGATFGMPTPALNSLDIAKIFAMWAMMSTAMMLPGALPMFRAYQDSLVRLGHVRQSVALAGVASVFGYLTVWLGYAVVATFAHWMLSKAGSLNDMMAPASMALTTSVLFAAGIYQFTPAKKACLERCWYPRWVFSSGEHQGLLAGYREGIVQGWACLGCCWAVMTVMFAVGLMNILWIALLGCVMALEKAFPSRIAPPAIGIFLIAWAVFLTIAIYV
ncbi:DUF2182 domain-containing protein [uncultured Roseibium sp.]|uniref:DUF2182 domain-containing protein n=1 Tax=uncultured Roseibium sp. TaxID=1936171 RepID=UPI00263797A8|nr:DUF2182 domain-containing protein [uncultured Roseibium sp.]